MAAIKTGGMLDPSSQIVDEKQSGNSPSGEETNDQAGQTGDEGGTEGEGTESGAESEGESTQSNTDTEQEEIDLIGQDRFDELTKKGDFVALRKELNRAATRKFQELSADRKALEPYMGFIEALDRDPRTAVTTLAQKLGMNVAAADGKTIEQQTKSLAEVVNQTLQESLGEEYGDLSAKLGPAILKIAETVVKENTKTLLESQEQIIQDSALREANLALESFSKKYPDWQKHEQKMIELSAKFPPGQDVSEAEYLEAIYALATRDGKTGDGVKKIVTKMAQSAKTGSAASGGSSDSVVARRPAKNPTFAEAAAAARQGIRFEP